MFVLTLQLSAAAGFHGSLWGKRGSQGSCCGAKWGTRAATFKGHAVPRPGLGPELSTVLLQDPHSMSPSLLPFLVYVSRYEYTEATANFWRFLGRIENFLDNSFFSSETCFYYVIKILQEKKHTLRECVFILCVMILGMQHCACCKIFCQGRGCEESVGFILVAG